MMRTDLLDKISGPQDVKHLTPQELVELCKEIRTAFVAFGKEHGGHIGSNLGLVEASVALHYVFDSPQDKIIFDVSHQAYAHKMLTGRADAFTKAEQFGTVTGFTNPAESEHDQFVLGHTGTAISLACGMAQARNLAHEHGQTTDVNNVVAIIGDGALSSAVAFEGLNNAGCQQGNLIIVLNDNEMSIAENHGGMYGTLAKMRESGGSYQPNLFEAFGLDYRYVEGGNDVNALVKAFQDVKNSEQPIVVHIHTTKGLGMDAQDAEHGVREGHCERNHWQDPLRDEGKPLGARKYYGQKVMDHIRARLVGEPNVVVISPATPGSNGIVPEFRKAAGSHYVDTGITEEHAVSYASGLAKAGCRPVVATSATFFQRTFDQLQQEVSLNGQPVTLLSFGGGMTGADNTHSGAFDIAMFGNIPGLTCLAPTSASMLLDMVDWSTSLENTKPVVIRVPGNAVLQADRGGLDETPVNVQAALHARIEGHGQPWSRYVTRQHGSQVALIGLGDAHVWAGEVVDALAELDEPIHASWINPLQFSSLDESTLRALIQNHSLVVTLEDGQLEGGWGEKITAFYQNELPGMPMHVLNFGLAKAFTDRVPVDEQRKDNHMTTQDIVNAICCYLSGETRA